MKTHSDKKSPASLMPAVRKKNSMGPMLKPVSHKEDKDFLTLNQNLVHLEQKAAFFNFAAQEITDLVG